MPNPFLGTETKSLLKAMFFIIRHVAKSKNLGGQVVMGGDNVPPLVEIGLTDPPKSGGVRPPCPPLETCLHFTLLASHSEYPRDKPFLLTMASYKKSNFRVTC